MVGSTTNRIAYNVTSASTAPLAVDFRFDDSGWLQLRYAETGAEESQLLVIGTHYTVGGDGTAIEGTVTLTSGFLDTITAGELVIARFTPAFQEVNLEYNTRFPAVAVENQMDETVMALQDRTDSDFQAGSRAIYLPPNEPTSNPNTLPLPSFRAGKFFAFDSTTGAIQMLSNEDAAIRILRYYGLEITSEDVLATISAIAPLRRFTPPTTSTEGLFGQLAIIPSSTSVIMTPPGFDPVTLHEVSYEEFLSLTGNTPEFVPDSSYPFYAYLQDGYPFAHAIYPLEQVPNWQATFYESPSSFASISASSDFPATPALADWSMAPFAITVTAGPSVEARAWINVALTGMTPDWREVGIDSNRSKTHVVIIGNSISVGQGTPEQSWPGQLEILSFFEGCTFHNLAVNGRTITTMDSTYEDEVAPFHPNGDDILRTYVFLISPASNDYSANSAIPLDAATINGHFDSILTKAKDGGCITVVGDTLRRGDVGVLPSDESIRQEINTYAKQSDLVDHFVSIDALFPDPFDTNWYAGGAIHITNISDRVLANVINGVMESKGAYMSPQGPKLSGGNRWREQQTIDLGLNGPDDHALKLNLTENVSTRTVVFTADDVIKHCIFFAGSGDGYAISWIDFVSGQTVWRTDAGCLVPGVAIKTSATYANDAAAAAASPPIPVGGWYARTSDNVVVRRVS